LRVQKPLLRHEREECPKPQEGACASRKIWVWFWGLVAIRRKSQPPASGTTHAHVKLRLK
jgi:hypothetical protein